VNALGDHKRSIAYANRALGRMKALRQPADPRSYAAWFTYATKCSPSQNRIVDDTIARAGGISIAELDTIYGYGPTGSVADKAGDLAAGLADQLGRITATMDVAVGLVTTYRDHVANVAGRLDHAMDQDALSGAIDNLLRAAKGVEAKHDALATSLQLSKREVTRLQQKLESLRTESRTDALTTLANRTHFERQLDRCMADADEASVGLCLLLMDIDHFSKINAAFGRAAGDEVLRTVSHSLKQHLQAHDVAARVGGEEFAVILPKVQLRSALTVADHMRCQVMGIQLIKRTTGESMGRVTISGGIACYRQGERPWDLMRRANDCLHAAKRHGHNQVICDDE